MIGEPFAGGWRLSHALGRPRGPQGAQHLQRLRQESRRRQGRAEEAAGREAAQPRQPSPPGRPRAAGGQGGGEAHEARREHRLRMPREQDRGRDEGRRQEDAPPGVADDRDGRRGEPGGPGHHGPQREERPADDPAAEAEARAGDRPRGPAQPQEAAEDEGAQPGGERLQGEMQQEEVLERAGARQQRGGSEHRGLGVDPGGAAAVQEIGPERGPPRPERRPHLGLPGVELEHHVVVGRVAVRVGRQVDVGNVVGDGLVEGEEELPPGEPGEAEGEDREAGEEPLAPPEAGAEPPGEPLERSLPEQEERRQESGGGEQGRGGASTSARPAPRR